MNDRNTIATKSGGSLDASTAPTRERKVVSPKINDRIPRLSSISKIWRSSGGRQWPHQ